MRFVQIQTASYCNAKCIICPHKDSWMRKHPGTMTDSLYQKILDELQEWEDKLNTGKMCPYLMNEPFCDSKIIDRIKLMREMFPNTLIEISTNAELMTPDKSKKLIDILAGTKHDVWISRHGVTPEDVKRNMFIDGERSLENIIYLLKEADGQLNIAIKGFLYSFDDKIRLSKPRAFIRYWQNKFKEHDIKTNNIRVVAKSFHDRSGNVKIKGWQKPAIVRHIGPNNKFYCPRVDKWLHILWNGDVILCCNDYQHETMFGNVKQQTIKEILNSDSYKRIKDMVLGNVETPKDFICNRCTRIGG